MKKLFLSLVSFFFLVSTSWATTYYVSNNGDGSLPQSPVEATCWDAADFRAATLLPGDTLYFLGTITGQYLNLPSSGNADNDAGRIFLRGDYPGNPGIIDANGAFTHALRGNGKDYITVMNISITGGTITGLSFSLGTGGDCDYLTVDGIESYGNAKGLACTGTNIEILNSTFRNNTSTGAYVIAADNAHIHDCKFYQNGTDGAYNHDGLFIGDDSENFIVEDCEAYENNSSSGSGIDFSGDNSGNSTGIIRRCKSYNNDAKGFSASGETGIVDTVTFSNCVAWGNNSNFLAYGVVTVNVYNCVSGSAGYASVRFTYDSSSVITATFKNNIISGDYPYAVMVRDVCFTSFTSEHNCWQAGSIAFGRNYSTDISWDEWKESPLGYDVTGSINANPCFYKASASNFTLRGNSPCIDEGTDVSITYDYNGWRIPNGSAPDMGAYEHYRKTYGGMHQSVCKKTSGTILKVEESGLVNLDSTGGVMTIYLPPLELSRGVPFFLHKDNAGNNITIVANGDGETIGGAANKTLANQYDTLILQGGTDQWYCQ